MPNKVRYDRLKASGLCCACGTANSVEGLTKCAKCFKRTAKNNVENYNKRKANCVCARCSAELTTINSWCNTCRVKGYKFKLKTRARYRKENKCQACSRPLLEWDTTKTCVICKTREQAWS